MCSVSPAERAVASPVDKLHEPTMLGERITTLRRHLRSPAGRALLAMATAALAVGLFMGGALAEAGDGISASGATVDKVGWWHSQNSATSTPAAVVTTPPPPGVPAGTLAVGAVNGEPDRITAIGILPDASSGDTISSFTMTIKEAGAPASGFNGAAAKIVACPIISFWVGGENGTWDTKPSYDCTIASAAGERALDGTWSFDLLAIGQAWVDPDGGLAADGIVLVEDVASPEGFQTVFATSGEGAIVVTIASEPGSGTDGGFDDGAFSDVGSDGSFSGGTDGFSSPSFDGGGVGVGGLPAPDVSTPAAGDTPQNAPPAMPRPIATSKPNVLGNFPGGLALAVPLFLVLLGLLTYSLGPAGEPAAATRQRGVSRALVARAAVDGTHRTPSSLETS